jgi:hypothetical protein
LRFSAGFWTEANNCEHGLAVDIVYRELFSAESLFFREKTGILSLQEASSSVFLFRNQRKCRRPTEIANN